uniref:Uncharacterized protein n=1 Tax=Anguilla anguilla TaxID=7936 RepID=A0A0E9QN52_ANGAN
MGKMGRFHSEEIGGAKLLRF